MQFGGTAKDERTSGPLEFLPKPVGVDTLVRKVREVLDGRSVRPQPAPVG